MVFDPNKNKMQGNRLDLDDKKLEAIFENFGYSQEKKQRDMAQLKNAVAMANREADARGMTFNSVDAAGDSAMLEEEVAGFLDREDEGGDELLGDALVNISHTHPFDDWCRGIDFVCTMQHETEDGFVSIPFFLDVTYNADRKTIQRKFRPHYEDIPGVGRAEYFKNRGLNMDSQGEKIIGESESINMAPKFVVGYDPNADWGEEPTASGRRKYTILQELTEQAAAMQKMYERRFQGTEMPKLLGKVYQDIKVLNNIFHTAMKEFKKTLDDDSKVYSEYNFGPYAGKTPDSYRKDVERIIHGNDNLVYNAISTQTDISYS